MKKLIFLMICCVLLVGCSDGSISKEQYESVVAERDQYKAALEAFSDQTLEGSTTSMIEEETQNNTNSDILSQLDVREYSMESSIGSTYYILVIKNNSPYTLSISANCTAKSSEGALIGAASSEENAIESGYEVCLINLFDDAVNVSSFAYELTAKEDTYNMPVLSDLYFEVSNTDKKAIVTCTNNGSEPAEFVKGVALFFKNDILINYDYTYFTDDDNEIKPGSTIAKELRAFASYDDVKIYYSGRR